MTQNGLPNFPRLTPTHTSFLKKFLPAFKAYQKQPGLKKGDLGDWVEANALPLFKQEFDTDNFKHQSVKTVCYSSNRIVSTLTLPILQLVTRYYYNRKAKGDPQDDLYQWYMQMLKEQPNVAMSGKRCFANERSEELREAAHADREVDGLNHYGGSVLKTWRKALENAWKELSPEEQKEFNDRAKEMNAGRRKPPPMSYVRR